MIPEKEMMCRQCKSKIKGEALYNVHKTLCLGSGSSYSIILSNVNNYERPGRERCSQHHRYRPSADRPRRSKSMPPKGHREWGHAKGGSSLAYHQRGRVVTPAAQCKRNVLRSKSIPPPEVNGRVKSGARMRRRLLSGPRRFDDTPTKMNGPAITTGGDSAISHLKDSGDPTLCDGRWEQIGVRTRSRNLSAPEDDVGYDPRKDSVSSDNTKTSLSAGESSPSPSPVDCAERTRLGISDYKPFFFNSESVPPSLEVARRRFHGGRRGYFCCEIGCSCRKCHYFSLSLVAGRQFAYLRRCNADCPCAKCHLMGSSKLLSSSSSAAAKKSASSSSVAPDGIQSPSMSSPVGVALGSSPRLARRQSRGQRQEGPASSQGGDAKSKEKKVSETEGESPSPRRRRERKEVCYRCEPCSKELYKWYIIRKHLMSSEHLQTVKDQRKQVNILKRNRGRQCKNTMGEALESTAPAQNINSESESPKERLMAGLDLVEVMGTRKDRDKTYVSCDTTLDGNCGVPLEPVAIPEATGLIEGASSSSHLWPIEEGNILTTSSPNVNVSGQSSSMECNLQNAASDCVHQTSPLARQSINLGLSPMKLMLRHYTQSQVNQLPVSPQSTFVRIDYKKNKVPVPASALHLTHSKPSVSASQEGQGSSLTPGMHANCTYCGLHECASVKENVYTCFRVHPRDLPTPFVDLGERCDSAGWRRGFGMALKRSSGTVEEPPKKMIRVDYHRKLSNSLLLDRTPSFGSLTYRSPGDHGDEVDRCPSPSSSIKSLVDEEALGERLILSDSEPEDNKEVLKDFGLLSSEESGDQMVMLDSQRFLSRFIALLNDGGLGCNSCGNKIDGMNVVLQVYNYSGRPQLMDDHLR